MRRVLRRLLGAVAVLVIVVYCSGLLVLFVEREPWSTLAIDTWYQHWKTSPHRAVSWMSLALGIAWTVVIVLFVGQCRRVLMKDKDEMASPEPPASPRSLPQCAGPNRPEDWGVSRWGVIGRRCAASLARDDE